MKLFYCVISALLISFSSACFSLELQEAKDKGLVGETPSGYLECPNGKPSAEVKALMTEINVKRKEKYQEIAAKVGKPLSIVEKLAGEKALEKTESGHYVLLPDGSWKKK